MPCGPAVMPGRASIANISSWSWPIRSSAVPARFPNDPGPWRYSSGGRARISMHPLSSSLSSKSCSSASCVPARIPRNPVISWRSAQRRRSSAAPSKPSTMSSAWELSCCRWPCNAVPVAAVPFFPDWPRDVMSMNKPSSCAEPVARRRANEMQTSGEQRVRECRLYSVVIARLDQA